MKNNLKQYRWYIIVLLCGFSLFFSCTDDPWEYQDNSLHQAKKSKNKNEELTITAAQQWYESNFAPVVTTRSSSNDSTNRMMKPYWEKAKESNRKRYEVVELPIRTKGGHLILDAETAQKCKSGEYSKFIRNTAKIVIERDTQTGRTRSFVMIFVGSYNYLQKTRSMGKNTYLYRQPDFDGSVLFFEINGTFVNGWQYENGKIVATIAPKQKEVATDSVSVQTRALVEDCEDLCFTYSDEECIEESWAEEDDEYGFSFGTTVSCFPVYYEECTTHCSYYDDGEDEEGGDNWWDDYPSGGSNTGSSGNTGNEDDKKPKVSVDLTDKTKFSGWRAGANCLDLAKETLKNYGITNYGSSSNVFRLVYETPNGLKNWGDNFTQNYKNAIECIDNHLDNKRVIIVGVDHTPNYGVNEGTTDHFVVITGRGYDESTNQYYYTFMDNATNSIADGCNDQNRFYYTEGSDLSGTSVTSEQADLSYTVSQVRPNDGEKYDTTTAYK